MPAKIAAKNRRERQEALREWLSKKCTAQHLVDNIEKIENLDSDSDTFVNDLAKFKTANDQRLEVLDKYLPSIKPVEVTGEDGRAVELDGKWVVEFVNADTEGK